MGQSKYLGSSQENVREEEKIDKTYVEQTHRADEDTAPKFQIWRFTKGDIFAMVMGGILGGIFSNAVIRLLLGS